MTGCVRRSAEAVLGQLKADIQRFTDTPDRPNGRIHVLFAGLYHETTVQWLKALTNSPAPDFAYAVMRRFYELYEIGVLDHLDQPLFEAPRQWRNYHRLARRLTGRSPISLHLLLLYMGARAHVRHDLAIAIRQAAQDFADRPDGTELVREELISTLSQQAFFRASLDFVELHRRQQRGWRRAVLNGYALGLRVLKPLLVLVIESWRGAAYRDAFRTVAPTPLPNVAGPESG